MWVLHETNKKYLSFMIGGRRWWGRISWLQVLLEIGAGRNSFHFPTKIVVLLLLLESRKQDQFANVIIAILSSAYRSATFFSLTLRDYIVESYMFSWFLGIRFQEINNKYRPDRNFDGARCGTRKLRLASRPHDDGSGRFNNSYISAIDGLGANRTRVRSRSEGTH